MEASGGEVSVGWCNGEDGGLMKTEVIFYGGFSHCNGF